MHRYTRFLGLAAVAAVLACDSGTDPHHHGGGDVCGDVAAVSGLFLQDGHSSDTLCTQVGAMVHGAVACHADLLLHGVQVRFRDEHGDVIPLAEDCATNMLSWSIADPGVVEITQDPGLRWSVNFRGRAAGVTTVRLQLHHAGHLHFESQPLPVQVAP